jgi:glutathione S-transferase
MKLYYMPGACSLSPHIVLNEAGLAFDKVKVDGKTKATDAGGDFRTANPLGYVPLLELDDGTRITEGPAIVQWIADKVPDKKLAPATGTMERVRLQSWLNFVTSELHKGFSPLFNPAQPEEAKLLFRQKLGERLKWVDSQLEGRDYLMGAQFTVADAYLYVLSGWSGAVGVDTGALKQLAAFMQRVAARPAVQAARQAEGLKG